jgi:hypothetical protein
MHGIRLTTRAALPALCLISLSGCMSIIAKKHTYGANASSPPVRVNGADIRMQVKPEGTDGGSYAISAMVLSTSVATLDGPFRWRIEATGQVGKQEYLVVHRIRTRTSTTQRDEWFSAALLGKRADFRKSTGPENSGLTRATYPIPGRLEVKPRVDGALEVSVDLTVVSESRRERKLVRFRMDPSQKRQDEFIFVPTEIINSIGKSTADWDETGWD